MKNKLYCVDCIEAKAGKPLKDLSVELFKQLTFECLFEGDKCPICGSSNIKKSFGMETSYIKGYGFTDKAGVKRDMDMHLMVKDQDPYKKHRRPGEKADVIKKLQKSKEHNKNSKTIHM